MGQLPVKYPHIIICRVRPSLGRATQIPVVTNIERLVLGYGTAPCRICLVARLQQRGCTPWKPSEKKLLLLLRLDRCPRYLVGNKNPVAPIRIRIGRLGSKSSSSSRASGARSCVKTKLQVANYTVIPAINCPPPPLGLGWQCCGTRGAIP